MTSCARCSRPIEPGQAEHRRAGRRYHGACLEAEQLDEADEDLGRRARAVEQGEAQRRARARLEADLSGPGDVVRS